MRVRTLGAIAVMAVLGLPTGVSASTEVDRLVSQAIGSVSGPDGRCAGRVLWPAPTTFTDAPPSDELLGLLGLLRRSPTEEDLAAVERATLLPLGSVHRSAVRVAHGADGRAYDLFAIGAAPPQHLARCSRLERRALRRLTRRSGDRVRRRARAHLAASQHARFHPLETERVKVLYDQDGAYGGGGGVSAADLRAGQLGLSAFGGGPSDAPTRLVAVVADGVASVTWHFAGGRSVVAPVRDNVATGEIDVGPFDLRLERTVQHDAAGAVLTDVPAERLRWKTSP